MQTNTLLIHVIEQDESPQLQPQDNRYQCDICKYEIEGYRSYVFHLKTIHKMYYIKELIKKHWLRLNDQDPPFPCPDCGKLFKTARHYEIHMGSAHKYDLILTVNKKILPIINDPNNYCQACEDTYSNKNNFKAHLRKVHSMAIINQNANIAPDPFDPNFYCQTCQKKYENRKKYRKHLYSIHNIRGVKETPKKNDDPTSIKPEADDSNQILRQPKETSTESKTKSANTIKGILKSKTINLKTITKPGANPIVSRITLRKRTINYLEQEVNSTAIKKRKRARESDAPLQPIIDDPNFFCRVCKKTYSNKYGYRVHLEHIHFIKPPGHVNTGAVNELIHLLPDPHDPDFYCRVCKSTKFNLAQHRQHCRSVHHMVFDREFKNPDAPIDIDCPNFYCPRCEKQFKGKYYYRSHLKSVHEIVYKQAKRKANNDVEIDIDSPDFYCAKCDKKFQEKYYFRRHLKYVHTLKYKLSKSMKKEKKRGVTFADKIDDA